VIIVGLARCIAMVLVWNEIARGDRDRAAVLVVFNAIFQLAAYSLLGYFYLTVLPGWLGLQTQGFQPGIWEIARTVLIFLGIPLTAGYLTRRIGLRRRGRDSWRLAVPVLRRRAGADVRARLGGPRPRACRRRQRPPLLRVADLREDRVHHQQQPGGDRQAYRTHPKLREPVVQVWQQRPEREPTGHRQRDPQRQETVKRR
jgi:hypothetical protein